MCVIQALMYIYLVKKITEPQNPQIYGSIINVSFIPLVKELESESYRHYPLEVRNRCSYSHILFTKLLSFQHFDYAQNLKLERTIDKLVNWVCTTKSMC